MDPPGAIYAARPFVQEHADLETAAFIFKVLGSANRLRVLRVLIHHGPMSTSELTRAARVSSVGWLEDLLGAGLITRTTRRGGYVWDADPAVLDRVAAILAFQPDQ